MTVKDDQPQFLWLGNHRALDFLNTEPVLRGTQVDLLPDPGSLVAWCEEAGIVDAAAAARVARHFHSSDTGANALRQTHRLRRALRALVEGGTRTSSTEEALDLVNRCLLLEAAQVQLARTRTGFVRKTRESRDDRALLLRPLAEAAVDLLCDADPKLVRRCENPECVLFFYDASKNHKRRWCSMDLCGNRWKVAAHYARRRAEEQ